MIGGIGMPELIIIMVIVMIIFGGRKLPEIGSGLGKAIQGFRKATEEPVDSIKEMTKTVESLKDVTKIEDKHSNQAHEQHLRTGSPKEMTRVEGKDQEFHGGSG